ncbi:unnamed protein product [Brassica rapa subsp. narinosa]
MCNAYGLQCTLETPFLYVHTPTPRPLLLTFFVSLLFLYVSPFLLFFLLVHANHILKSN